MRIYIVEDDINIIKQLQKIISERELGIVVGYCQDGKTGLNQISSIKPDISLVDFFMPEMNGIELVTNAKKIDDSLTFVMISQVTDKSIIGKAYEHGIEYYINKPINALEVENVIRKVTEKHQLEKTLMQIKNLLNLDDIEISQEINYQKRIRRVMQKIGIIGEVGSNDIFMATKYLIDNNLSMNQITIKELCNFLGENPKSIEQRIRRTALIGLGNLAHLGIEDYMNEIFIEYVNSLYTFEQVRKEMDYIRDESDSRAKINIKKFLDGIVFLSTK